MFRFLLSAFLTLSTTFVNAQLLYKEGTDYIKIEKPVDNAQSPKVIEFFWFGCPHCYSIEPNVKKWLTEKSPEISFEKVPAIPNERWETGARIYYLAQELSPDLVDKIFYAVHEENHNSILFNKERAKQFFKNKSGVKEQAFDKSWDSFSVQQKLTRAKELFEMSKFDGVPAFLVNGTYAVPMHDEAPEVFFKRLDFIAKNLTPEGGAKSETAQEQPDTKALEAEESVKQ